MKVRQDGTELDEGTSACWRALNLLADRVRGHGQPVRVCSLLIGDTPKVHLSSLRPPAGDGWRVSLVLDSDPTQHGPPPTAGESRYALQNLIMLRRLAEGALPPAAAALLELYVPYCVAPLHARRMGRPFTVSHFAQSLDGRIATRAGDSRWIGCAENRVHAHRMRALCDGILIGARTLRTDRPALTVRHTEGSDPARIVVGGAVEDGDIACLERAGPSPILLIGDGEDLASPQVERLPVPIQNGRIATAAILRELYRREILSVNIDVLQLHISPMIVGPGISSFSQPAIRCVSESVRFDAHLYRSVGDGVMFVGRVAS
jgi:diaminohydroxyphosphoribosylaminopyrimidine deaminase/5-amino-6-(5-phosphoribosylamino)uracil reductase